MAARTARAAGTTIVELAGPLAGGGATIHDEVGLAALGDGDDAETTTAGTVGSGSFHLVDPVVSRGDLAWKTIAASVRTLDSHAPIGHSVSERRGRFEIDGVPAKFDKGLSVVVRVGTGNVRAPVANITLVGSPDACLTSIDSRRIDVEMSRRLAPIVGTRISKNGRLIDLGRDQHGLVTRQHRLAERDDTAGLVLDANVCLSRHAIWFVRERLRDLAIVVAVQSTVLITVSATLSNELVQNLPWIEDKYTKSPWGPIAP